MKNTFENTAKNILEDSKEVLTVRSAYFDAGAVLTHGIVINAAPIIKYTIGWTRKELVSYVKMKCWKLL